MIYDSCKSLSGLICLVAVMTAPASADIISTFDNNSEGWSVVSFSDLTANNYSLLGTYNVAYNASSGNPGGYSPRQIRTMEISPSAPLGRFLATTPLRPGCPMISLTPQVQSTISRLM